VRYPIWGRFYHNTLTLNAYVQSGPPKVPPLIGADYPNLNRLRIPDSADTGRFFLLFFLLMSARRLEAVRAADGPLRRCRSALRQNHFSTHGGFLSSRPERPRQTLCFLVTLQLRLPRSAVRFFLILYLTFPLLLSLLFASWYAVFLCPRPSRHQLALWHVDGPGSFPLASGFGAISWTFSFQVRLSKANALNGNPLSAALGVREDDRFLSRRWYSARFRHYAAACCRQSIKRA